MLKLFSRLHVANREGERGTGRQPRSVTRWQPLAPPMVMPSTARASLREQAFGNGLATIRAGQKSRGWRSCLRKFWGSLLLLVVVLELPPAFGGDWTPNLFFYNPSYGASGVEEYNLFASGLSRVDSHLGKYKTLGDPGYETLSKALATIGSSKVTLVIPAGEVTVDSYTKIPYNVSLSVMHGGRFFVKAGVTLEIKGRLEAGPYQIFAWSGTGAIRIGPRCKEVLADWFIPDTVTDHTAYIKKAVESGFTGTPGQRTPVILTQQSYNIANLTFDSGADGVDYTGTTLIGRGGVGSAAVTLVVSGATNNGIFFCGSYPNGSWCNYIRLENLFIKKTAYPGDNKGDFGVKLRQGIYARFKNVRVDNFGGAAFEINWVYTSEFQNLEAWNNYQGINFVKGNDAFAATTLNFVNCGLFGCKTSIRAGDIGLVQAHFRGLTTDDHTYRSTTHIDISNKDKTLNFTDCWFEGLVDNAYLITIRTGSGNPKDNILSFKNSFLALKNNTRLVTAEGNGTATIALNEGQCYYSDLGYSIPHKQITVIPNYADTNAIAEIGGATDSLSSSYPKIVLSTPSMTVNNVTKGPRGIALLNGHTKDAWGGTVVHRFYDAGIGLDYSYGIDGFRSSITGLWASQLELKPSDYYPGGNPGIRIVNVSAIPTATTCNTSTATPHKLTNIASGAGQFSAGDKVVITGAGTGGANLTTNIVHIEWDATALYVKDPVQATLKGTGLVLSGAQGDMRLNRAPAEQGSSGSKYVNQGWRCTVTGTPGTWLEMRTLTGN